MKKLASALLIAGLAMPAVAADYKIDMAHSAIEFKVSHLGFSWLKGRFNQFEGNYSYDPAQPEQTSIQVQIDPASVDSNHAERDKHLRSGDFLNVAQNKTASFESTSVEATGEGQYLVKANLTLNGVTKPIEVEVAKVGEGNDPWGNYRTGFEGTTSFMMKDFNVKQDLGPASQEVFLTLQVEGIRQ